MGCDVTTTCICQSIKAKVFKILQEMNGPSTCTKQYFDTFEEVCLAFNTQAIVLNVKLLLN